MAYRIDPELAESFDLVSVRDWSDPAGARTAMDDLVASLNASVDTTGLTVVDRMVPGPPGGPEVAVRIYAPSVRTVRAPGSAGHPRRRVCLRKHRYGARRSGPPGPGARRRRRHRGISPGPGASVPSWLEDCYAALSWMVGEASMLGIDTDRVGLFGQSAGGGLSAALALRAATGAARRCASSSSVYPSSTIVSRRRACSSSWTHRSGTGVTPS